VALFPANVSCREVSVRLMQTHVVVCVDPHPTNARTRVDQEDTLVTGEMVRSDGQRIEPGDASSDDANLERFCCHRDLLPSVHRHRQRNEHSAAM
jgi:hypothetical protein